MKKFLLLPLIALTIFFTSCEKDPMVVFPGTWNIDSNQGTLTFNADGTGYSLNSTSSFFESFCATSDTSYFTWVATPTTSNSSSGMLYFEFLDMQGGTSCGSLDIKYKIKSKKRVQLGETVLGLGIEYELTKQ